MVSQNQDSEWSDHPPVRSGSMLSLDGRQRPQVARTPPSYYDAVRSRHSLSHPVGRQQESSKQEKQFFPPHEKYNSLPRPLPQRYAVAMTNGHEKFSASHGSPWPGLPQQQQTPLQQPNANGGWNSVSTDVPSPSPHRSERPPRPHDLPHEYRSPPGPANPVPQVHLPSRSREGLSNQLSTAPFPGQYNSGIHHEQTLSPPYKHSVGPADDGQQQQHGGAFIDTRGPLSHYSLQSSPHRRHPPVGPRQHPPPPPIPLQQQQQQQQRLNSSIQSQMVTSPHNGTLEMRKPNHDRRDTDGAMHNGRWMRRSYPSTSEEMSAHESQYYRSHSQELSQGHSQSYDPRYSKSGTLPSRTRSRGADLGPPAPAVSVRMGPLGTYPESRPTHMDHLPPPSSPQPSSLPDMSNRLSPRERNGFKQTRSPYSEKERTSKVLEPKSYQHQSSSVTLNDALLFPNGLPLRKSVSSSTASLCSESSSASSRARRMQNKSNGDAPIKRVPLNTSSSRAKVATNEVHAHGKTDKDSVISPSPWAREEKEQLQKRQVQDARRARDEEIEYLESLPDRTQKQEEILRILRLEREFQKRAEEVADGDDEEDEDELLERAEHMERMLRMQEETARSKQGNLGESHLQHNLANSSDDWLVRRKMHHLSRIAEENGDFYRDLHFQNATDVEQMSEFLDNLSMRTKKQDSPSKKQDLLDFDCRKTSDILNGSINDSNGQQDINVFNSCDANNALMVNGSERPHTFPVPAPRTSKTHIPPPVPPKSKTDSNGFAKLDDAFVLCESISAVGCTTKEVRSSQKEDGSTSEMTSLSLWTNELKGPVSQTVQSSPDSNRTINGLPGKTERARDIDIATLYASSKMRNGFVDSRPELQKFPELQKLWTSRPEKLTFQDKIRKFSLQAGEEEVPKDKVKNSRAQREIEIKFSEAQAKSLTQET